MLQLLGEPDLKHLEASWVPESKTRPLEVPHAHAVDHFTGKIMPSIHTALTDILVSKNQTRTRRCDCIWKTWIQPGVAIKLGLSPALLSVSHQKLAQLLVAAPQPDAGLALPWLLELTQGAGAGGSGALQDSLPKLPSLALAPQGTHQP